MEENLTTTFVDVPTQEEKPAPLTTLARISLLSDLANSVNDQGIISAIKDRPNGSKLYDLFVQSVSNEIERLMNPAQAAPKIMTTAADAAERVLAGVNHVGAIFAAIENSPTLAVLETFLRTLGGNLQQQQVQQRVQPSSFQQQQQQLIQQQQQLSQQNQQQYSENPQPRGSSGTGSW